jgi:hypothetical protein
MAGGLLVRIEVANPDEVEKIIALGDRFEEAAKKVFGAVVFEAHKYLIRVTPIDTGELRGGWTSWLDKNQIDYSRQLYDLSLADKAPGRSYHIEESAIQQGKSESAFEAPSPFDITIINNTPHGFYLEEGTSAIPGRYFVELARYKTELVFEKIFTDWFYKIAANDGELVEPDVLEEPAA